MTHICDKCGKKFEYQYLLKKHQNRKTLCNSINNINDIYDNKILNIEIEINKKTNESLKNGLKCLFCNNKFSTKTNTLRHIKENCSIKKELENEILNIKNNKNKIIEDNTKIVEKKEMDELKEMMLKLLESKTSQNIIVNNNKVINNNLIININSFGKEDLSHITIDDYKKYLNGFFPGFIKFIEKVHFDKNAPQNNNICISNINSKYMHVYENNDWKLQEKNDVIDMLMMKKYNLLGEKCEQLQEDKKLNKKIIDNFEEFCHNYTDKEAQKTTKKNTILMIYNNKDKLVNKPKTLDIKKIDNK